MKTQVAIVGAGPAGLAMAIECATRGVACVVFDRRTGPIDKACGEGLMPPGLAALERLGARQYLTADDCAPFEAIRYQQEDGRFVDAPLPAPGGLGVRRLALARALRQRADELRVDVREHTGVRAHRRDRDGVTLVTDAGDVRAELLVAADGLHSPIRTAEGLEIPSDGPRRFGLRQHFAVEPWGARVEVHFTDGAEAYVTPAGQKRVGIAFLWRDGAVGEHVSFDALLAKFPALQRRLAGAVPDSKPMGAGPLLHTVTSRTADRLVLLGDAAGYVDAITGEGLSLAFDAAQTLGAMLPQVLAEQGSLAALAPYERQTAAAFRRYAFLASSLVAVAGRPALRRFIVDRLIAWPGLFRSALHAAVTP